MSNIHAPEQVGAGSAYTTDPRVPTASPHFTGIGAFSQTLDVPAASTDPLGFSYERMLRGEADMNAGSTRSLAGLLDALRSRDRRQRG